MNKQRKPFHLLLNIFWITTLVVLTISSNQSWDVITRENVTEKLSINFQPAIFFLETSKDDNDWPLSYYIALALLLLLLSGKIIEFLKDRKG